MFLSHTDVFFSLPLPPKSINIFSGEDKKKVLQELSPVSSRVCVYVCVYVCVCVCVLKTMLDFHPFN